MVHTLDDDCICELVDNTLHPVKGTFLTLKKELNNEWGMYVSHEGVEGAYKKDSLRLCSKEKRKEEMVGGRLLDLFNSIKMKIGKDEKEEVMKLRYWKRGENEESAFMFDFEGREISYPSEWHVFVEGCWTYDVEDLLRPLKEIKKGGSRSVKISVDERKQLLFNMENSEKKNFCTVKNLIKANGSLLIIDVAIL